MIWREGQPSTHLRSNALRGRRIGKPLPDYQKILLAELLPQLSIDTTREIDPTALFARPLDDLRLEIGFGAGEHMLAAAKRMPGSDFIGCEPFVNGMARALAELASADLDNVRLHCGDAADVVDALPDACLACVYILYPDPWPKRRQSKRRFVTDDMLDRMARIMRPGAELRFATDSDDYCGWTLARLQRSSRFRWSARSASDWQTPWPDWIPTRYEAKAAAEGRRGCYVTAFRT